jgi:signal transduction histidine kinase
VASISGSALDRRVPEPGTDDEIGRLARTMNAMLERLEDSATRQERFVADASHELRSPLTRLRTQLEVGLAHPEAYDAETTERGALEDAIEMQKLLDDLLFLARGDAGALDLDARSVVDLEEVVLASVARADRGALDLSADDVAALRVLGDERALGRAVGNVVDNAVRHARHSVILAVHANGDDAVLTVDDDGPGIAREDAERVFERFGRVDESRSTTTGGAGLGLSIAREIVQRHGGTIRIDTDGRPGTRVVIRLPLA